MTVTCKADSLSAEDRQALGIGDMFASKYMLTVGKSYTVLGLSQHVGSVVFGSAPTVELVDDGGRLVSVPAPLFRIGDGRPSRFWRVRQLEAFGLALWPEEFYTEFFHDDLSEGVPEVRRLFEHVVRKIDEESLSQAPRDGS
jgi:hypothetical protein